MEKVIVYRSSQEATQDFYLWEEGGIVWVGATMVFVFVAVIVWAKISEWMNRRKRK